MFAPAFSSLASPFRVAARLSATLTAFLAGVASVSLAAGIVSAVVLVAVESAAVSCDRIARNFESADCIAGRISFAVYVSQNSRLAEPWRSFLTRSGSLIPGSSTMIRPILSSRLWMFGWTTPKRSIRVRSTLYEFSTAAFTSALNTFSTSASDDFWLTLSFNCCVAKSSESFAPGAVFWYSLTNKVMMSSWLLTACFAASFNALLKFSSGLLSANALITSGTETSRITFIPPFRSKPKLISISRQSFSVQFHSITFSLERESR